MSQRWKNLRGAELAVFAASPKVLNETPNLIAHIAKHGTVDDFNNIINQHQDPEKYCVSVYRRFPQAAEQWLLNSLGANDENTPITHYEVVRGVLANDAPKKFMPHINFALLSKEQLDNVFSPMLRNGLKEHIVKNWGVFAPVVTNASNTNRKVLEAATVGWDLATLINWSPTPDTKDVYFKCCCQGGLLEQAKRCGIPSTLATVCDAFTQTCIKHPKNAEEVLNYLWDAFPHTPWHVFNQIVSRLCTVSPTLTEKMVEHFKIHNPEGLKQEALSICCFAAARGNVKLLEMFLPFVDPRMHNDVVANAINSQQKDALKTLLSFPDITIDWRQNVLYFLSPSSKQWWEEFVSHEQAKMLTTAIPSSVLNATKRKM